tara:strand:- start:1863 stop:2111 length:249 start_codon:yes stop_codon:yes gene_type:complete
MNSKKLNLEESLVEKYGPLLTMAQLAELLHRSPDGLRIALQSRQPYTEKINQARLKIGRRVYFRASQIADLLSNDFLSSEEM